MVIKHSVKLVIWNLSFHCVRRTLIFQINNFLFLVFPCLYTKYLSGILTNTKQNITRYKNCTITIYNALVIYFFVFIRSSHYLRDIRYKIVFSFICKGLNMICLPIQNITFKFLFQKAWFAKINQNMITLKVKIFTWVQHCKPEIKENHHKIKS